MTLDELIDAANNGERFTVSHSPGIAYFLHGIEQVPADEWCDEYTPTGMVYMVMVGDDYRHLLDPADVSILPELDYCHVCGQVGCTHDGLERP